MIDEFRHIRAYHTGWLLAITDWITIIPILRSWARKTTRGLSIDGLEHVERGKGYLFITNHRDIVMDSAWLSLLLKIHKNIRPYIGIGNNLFGKWWIEPLVRINHAFVVIRNGGIREQMAHSQELSRYMRHLIDHHHSIWLAQREGRAKDGNDLTQPAVLKMLALSSDQPFLEAITSLNICPVCINYEYDPCDWLKAQEMQLKRDDTGWKKSKEDDLLSMTTGIRGWKGDVHFSVTPCLNQWIAEHKKELMEMNRNEQIQAICQRIDYQIHSHYRIYPRGTEFEQYLQQQLSKIHISNKDDAYLMARLKEMYQNPVNNYEKSHLSGEF